MEEKYLKRQRIYKSIMLVILTAFITCILTTVFLANKYDLGNNSLSSLIGNATGETDSLVSSIKSIETIIQKYYLKEIDEQAVIDGAIDGYVSALGDPYTEYIPTDEMEEYTENIMGNYVGIGIYMVQNTEKNVIEVLTPIKESPAEAAGIHPGDIIVAVDGVEYSGEEMTAASNSIKGEEGTKVKLTILRGTETLEVEITRSKINTNPVIAETLENNIGYLEVSSFDEGTADEFKTKYETLKNQGITSLIIELRKNDGGLVDPFCLK